MLFCLPYIKWLTGIKIGSISDDLFYIQQPLTKNTFTLRSSKCAQPFSIIWVKSCSPIWHTVYLICFLFCSGPQSRANSTTCWVFAISRSMQLVRKAINLIDQNPLQAHRHSINVDSWNLLHTVCLNHQCNKYRLKQSRCKTLFKTKPDVWAQNTLKTLLHRFHDGLYFLPLHLTWITARR